MSKGIVIDIADDADKPQVDHDRLSRTVRHTVESLGVAEAAVSVALVGHKEMTVLKKRYFGGSGSTDVISFDLRDRTQASALDCEIVINVERAVDEAQTRNGDYEAELNLYAVHGLLHQLGYDDQDRSGAEAMHHKEDELLEELGFGKVFLGNQARGTRQEA